MNMPPSPAIRTEKLCLGVKSDGWVLEDLSLSIEPGQRVVLFGGSGSGKSVLLHALFGFFPDRQEGEIEVLGQFITPGNKSEVRQRMGLAFQNPEDQFICATVEEELRFGPENLGHHDAEVERRVAQYARLLQLENLLDRPPMALSWGEKKRVALASVLVAEPEVLLVDDPFSGLPQGDQVTVAEALVQTQHTLLVTSPLFPPPENFGTHWATLDQGRLVRFGPKEDFRAYPCPENP